MRHVLQLVGGPRCDWGAGRLAAGAAGPYSQSVSIYVQPSESSAARAIEPDSPANADLSLPARLLGPIFSARTWLAVVYLVSGLPIAIAAFTLAVTGLALALACCRCFFSASRSSYSR